MKYTAKPIEIEAFKITGIGQVHADGTFSVQIDTGETIKNSDGEDVAETEIMTAAALPIPEIGDYFIANIEGNAVECVTKKADFEARYESEEAPIEPVSTPALTEAPISAPEPMPIPYPEPDALPVPEPLAGMPQ